MTFKGDLRPLRPRHSIHVPPKNGDDTLDKVNGLNWGEREVREGVRGGSEGGERGGEIGCG